MHRVMADIGEIGVARHPKAQEVAALLGPPDETLRAGPVVHSREVAAEDPPARRLVVLAARPRVGSRRTEVSGTTEHAGSHLTAGSVRRQNVPGGIRA
jgi:hypothetical protein